jgi:hypothetical protein
MTIASVEFCPHCGTKLSDPHTEDTRIVGDDATVRHSELKYGYCATCMTYLFDIHLFAIEHEGEQP